MHITSFHGLSDVTKAAANKASSAGTVIRHSCQRFGSWSLSVAEGIKKGVTRTSPDSQREIPLFKRSLSNQSGTSDLDQLQGLLTNAQTEEQLVTLADRIKPYFNKFLARLSGHPLEEPLRTASDKLKSVLSEQNKHAASSTTDSFELKPIQIKPIQVEALRDEQTTKSRADQMEQVEQDLSDLHESWVMLHDLAHQQGEVVDSLEDHMTNTEMHIEGANADLKSAENSAHHGRRLKVTIGIALAVLQAVAVVVACL